MANIDNFLNLCVGGLGFLILFSPPLWVFVMFCNKTKTSKYVEVNFKLLALKNKFSYSTNENFFCYILIYAEGYWKSLLAENVLTIQELKKKKYVRDKYQIQDILTLKVRELDFLSQVKNPTAPWCQDSLPPLSHLPPSLNLWKLSSKSFFIPFLYVLRKNT